MGLIKAALGSVSSVLGDQWREYFYCDSMPSNVLVTKGRKRTGNNSQNTKGTDNIITNGAVIAVNEGQCMMIVDQGQIVEFAAEAGEFTWNAPPSPPSSTAVWVRASRAAGRTSSAVSLSAVTPERISGSISSI